MRNSYRKLTSVLGTFALILSTISLAVFATPNANAQIRGLTVDFAAAEPTSYNHLVGGGQWSAGNLNTHIARSLAGDNFKCGDIVSYLSKYETDASDSITGIEPFTITSEFNFDLDTTGQSGAILGDVLGVTIDSTDPAQVGDKNSVASLTSETRTGPDFTRGSKLVALVDVTDLERNEVVIVRMDVKIICDPRLRPTGDLQARFRDALLTFKNGTTQVLPPEPVGVGEKTVPLKKLNALAIPQLSIAKTVTTGSGTCPGVESLTVLPNELVKYCYEVLNTANGGGNPAAPIYNLSVISDDSGIFPDFTIPIATGLTDEDGDGNADDLAAGATARAEVVKSFDVNIDTTVLNTATVSGFDSIIDPLRLDASDTAELVIDAPALVPSVALNKLTNGGDGVSILVGEAVTWSYQITNNGNTPLTNISVLDDKGVTVICPQSTLSAGQSITCDGSGVALIGPYTNSATVSATYLSTVVTATDTSSYFGASPSMTMDKMVNGVEAAEIAVGTPITWTYTVLNTGNVAIDSLTVVDDKGVTVTCPKTTLAIGESVICTGTGIAIAGNYENKGTARANFNGTVVSAEDTSNYFGVIAAISLSKTTNGTDSGTIITLTPIEWQYLVINTGNVFLTNIVVVDDKGLSVVCPAPNLNPGEAMTCLASGFAGIGTYSNVGTVTANHDAFNVTASDPSSYFGANPLLTLKKFTNGAEAPDIPVGNSVNWTYLVKNTGNVTVSGISVTDDQGVVVTCPKSVLLIDEEMTCTGSGVATAGWYRNLGTVNGSFEQTNVSAQDSSTYYGSAPAVTLEKTTNGSDNPTIPVGSPVTWVYRVTNTGNVDIDTVVVTDNQGVSVICPKTALLIGEVMQCSGSGTATAGNYSNIGTVTANYKGLQITANDSSSYFGSAPSIDVQKTPDSQVVIQGQSVTFTVTVTNTGNIPLTNVDVSDPLAPNCNRNFANLAVAEVQTFTCTLTNLQSTFTNIATVTANTGTTTISDSDSAEVVMDILPDITLSKTSSVNSVPAIGGLVDYTLRVTNAGSEAVVLTSLSDNKVTLSPACTALIGQSIAAGAYLECIIPGVLVTWNGSPTFVNTATAVATDPEQNSDTATASATVTIAEPAPALDVQKTPDTQTVVQGQSASFTITVTNTGNVPLVNIVVADPLAPDCAKSIASLAIAEVQTFNCTLTNVQSSFTNIATVTATYGQTNVSDQDSADVAVDVLPDITLTKNANVTTVPVTGGLVDYTLRISNVGGEAVVLTALSDDKVTLSPACAALIGQTIAIGSYLECVIPGVNVVWTGSSTFINTATAVGTDPQQNADTASASATVTFGWYGRTPGFWKNQPEAWAGLGYTNGQTIRSVFTVPTELLKSGLLDISAPAGEDTLNQGLSYRGGSTLSGSFQILMRAAIAALLNEAYYGIYYPGATSTTALIAEVNSVLATKSRTSYLTLAATLDNWNNAIHSSLP
jgi:uncharacterized repeat protein (TIGR01451 family)